MQGRQARLGGRFQIFITCTTALGTLGLRTPAQSSQAPSGFPGQGHFPGQWAAAMDCGQWAPSSMVAASQRRICLAGGHPPSAHRLIRLDQAFFFTRRCISSRAATVQFPELPSGWARAERGSRAEMHRFQSLILNRPMLPRSVLAGGDLLLAFLTRLIPDAPVVLTIGW
ncbi:hypothetical protein BJY00DRAFT_200923 [Aspergillus carlsbadensis]|nr:hypothetical protein BJY00DRAFT_200923 [Aspergillus carlsbadensis]